MKVDITVTITYTKDLDDSLYFESGLRRYPKDWSVGEVKDYLLDNKTDNLKESIYEVVEDLEHTDYDMTVKVTEKED